MAIGISIRTEEIEAMATIIEAMALIIKSMDSNLGDIKEAGIAAVVVVVAAETAVVTEAVIVTTEEEEEEIEVTATRSLEVKAMAAATGVDTIKEVMAAETGAAEAMANPEAASQRRATNPSFQSQQIPKKPKYRRLVSIQTNSS